MALSAEDTLIIQNIVEKAIEHDRATMRERRLREASEAPKPEPKASERKLMLITTSHGTEVGFPDEKGRVILNRSFYGWITRVLPRANDWDQSIRVETSIEVVGYGDGRRLDVPMTITLTTWTSMVEVQESVIDGDMRTRAAG